MGCVCVYVCIGGTNVGSGSLCGDFKKSWSSVCVASLGMRCGFVEGSGNWEGVGKLTGTRNKYKKHDLLMIQELRFSLIQRQQLENRPSKETISDPLLL